MLRLVRFIAVWGIFCHSASLAFADPQVQEDTLGPDGQCLGGSISPQGDHAAILATKGSHFVVLYDGVEGPKIDGLLANLNPSSVARPVNYWGGQMPVLFCNDGSHWVYLAKSGDEYVVMLDGKEMTRGPLNPNAPGAPPVCFSAGGKHLFYTSADDAGKFHIVVDGQPGPAMYIAPNLYCSPDGQHYAYSGAASRSEPVWGFVDGRQVNYFGEISQYTGRNVLVSTLPLSGAVGLVLNGKPEIKAQRLDPMWISPDGAQIAMVITPNAQTPSILSVNGKIVPQTQGLTIQKVYFSPNGKRWAALCQTKLGAHFMIVDGKKMDEYADIPATIVCAPFQNRWKYVSSSLPGQIADVSMVPGFTADSSKFVYVAGAAAQEFLIVDDNESNGFGGTVTLQPVLSPTGNRYGVLAVARDGIQHLLIDDKDTAYDAFAPAANRIGYLSFSPNSTHYAFTKGQVLYLDGVAQPGAGVGEYVFSPDESHIAYVGNLSDVQCVIADGKKILDRPISVGHIFYSPDSQHIYWISTRNLAGTKDSNLLFVDGKPGPHFTPATNPMPMTFAFGPNDELTFVALVDGNPRRIHVTSDTSLPAVLAAAPAAK